MRILISGSTGLVGSALVKSLENQGQEVVRLVRQKPSNKNQIQWNPEKGKLEASELEGFDAVVHLAGENIASGRWSDEKKDAIRNSRIQGTRLLAEKLAQLSNPPKVLISASAIGYYGDRGDEILTEVSSSATGRYWGSCNTADHLKRDFLSETCQAWEAAALPAKEKGIRVVELRTGVVLSKKGGALKMMLPIFQLGGGGTLGDGHQYMSWIALDDVVGAINHALHNEDLSGPVNVTAPNPVTNKEFTHTLGRVLLRPTLFPVPETAVKVAFGEMGDALLLSSTRVLPVRLEESHYTFQYPKLEPALRHVLKN